MKNFYLQFYHIYKTDPSVEAVRPILPQKLIIDPIMDDTMLTVMW